MRPLGLVDGKLINLEDNIVPMEDRGHQFGDGVYEVTRVYNGRCFALKPHMDRLYRSLREVRIPATYTFEELMEFHEWLIEESGITEGSVYLQITRGVAPRAHGFPEQIIPRLSMSIRPITDNEKLRRQGTRVILIPDERWLRCDIKSLNLLGNVLGKQKAKEAGCYDAVQVRDGNITEGTNCNFFIVKDGVLWTHPATNLILKGITRTFILEKLAPEAGIPVLEKAFNPEFVKKADEAFLSGTTTEIMPVTAIGDRPIADGAVGPVTRKLQKAYNAMIEAECGRK